MRTARALLLWLAASLVICATQASAHDRGSARKSRDAEPFRSFALIDAKLTALQTDYSLLQQSHSTGVKRSTAKSNRQRATAARRLRAAAATIATTSRKLENRYRSRRARFGHQMFRDLRIKATAVERNAMSVTAVRPKARTSATKKKLDQSILDLVLQFQAVSGGYAAMHCNDGSWACCEPKNDAGRHADACRWICTAKTRACTGFLGPRMPYALR